MDSAEGLTLIHKPVAKVSPSELDACYKLVRRLRGMYIGAQEGWDRRQKLIEMRETPDLEYYIFKVKQSDTKTTGGAGTSTRRSWPRIAAFASFTLTDDFDGEQCAYLWEIHVDPMFKRHGLGTRLLHEIFKKVAAEQKPLMLRCFTSNTSAQKFYEKEGFIPQHQLADAHSIYYKWDPTKPDTTKRSIPEKCAFASKSGRSSLRTRRSAADKEQKQSQQRLTEMKTHGENIQA